MTFTSPANTLARYDLLRRYNYFGEVYAMQASRPQPSTRAREHWQEAGISARSTSLARLGGLLTDAKAAMPDRLQKRLSERDAALAKLQNGVRLVH